MQHIDGVLQLAEGQDVYQLLGSPYQELWLHWLDEGNEAYKQQAKNSNQERLDFVRSVVAAAASSAVASQNSSTRPTDSAAKAATKEVPKVSIRAKRGDGQGRGMSSLDKGPQAVRMRSCAAMFAQTLLVLFIATGVTVNCRLPTPSLYIYGAGQGDSSSTSCPASARLHKTVV